MKTRVNCGFNDALDAGESPVSSRISIVFKLILVLASALASMQDASGDPVSAQQA